MKTTSTALALTILLAGIAVAKPAGDVDWASGPVKFLMTGEETARWAATQTDAKRKAFIDLFWLKRDPNLSTPENEWKIEFEKRVALADLHFTTKRTPGSLTDRGRVLILLGSPLDQGSKGAARSAAAGQVRATSAMLVWTYAQDKKPKFINRKDFVVTFVDDQGDGQYALAKTEKLDPESVLQEAVQFYVFNPEATLLAATTAMPRKAVASFRTLALKDACDQFRSEGKKSEGPAMLTWGQFVTPEGEVFVPVQLFVPAGGGLEAGRKLTFFGVVENANGEVVDVHEDEVTLQASVRDAYVDKSLKLQPGTYKATFGLAEGGKVLTMTGAEMTVSALDPKEPAISDMILSNNSYALAQAQKITDPFAFGGFKVVPKADGQFHTSDDIYYFYELRNPGKDEASGQPKVQVKINIEGKTLQDKPVKMNYPIQEFPTFEMKGVTNHFGLPLAFSAKDFKPGKYTVTIKVIDTVLKRTYQSERQFEIKG